MILPVVFHNKPDAFCNLPSLLANRQKNTPFAVVQFLWNDSTCNSHSQYVAWIGGVASGDAIELPASQFQSVSHSCITIEAVLTHIEKADEVYFTPVTGYDWDVISTQAAIVEAKLLTQLSIAYKHQIIRIQISSSLSATLECTGVKSESNRFASLYSNDISERIVPSSTATNSVGQKNDQNSPDFISESITVFKLSADTLAVIAPYTSRDEEDTSFSGRGNSKNDARGGCIGRYEIDIVSLMKGIEEGSTLRPLRVLPQTLRFSDTRYKFDRFGGDGSVILTVKDREASSNNSSSCNDSYLENLMNELLTGDAWENKDSSIEQELKLEDRGNLFFDDTSTDENSCFVSPSFLQAAYKSSMMIKYEKQSTENSYQHNPSMYDRDELFNKNLLPYYIGVLYSSKGHDLFEKSSTKVSSGDNTVKSLIDSIIVSVRVSTRIRPFHISLPECIKKAINASDYSHIRLQIKGTTGPLGNSLKSPIMPYMMSLQPIIWRNIPEEYENNLKSNNIVDNNFDIYKKSLYSSGKDLNQEDTDKGTPTATENNNEIKELNLLRESFVEYFLRFKNNCNVNNKLSNIRNSDNEIGAVPLILCNGCVITLTHQVIEENHQSDNFALNINDQDNNDRKFERSPLKNLLMNNESNIKKKSQDYLIQIYKNKSSISDINNENKTLGPEKAVVSEMNNSQTMINNIDNAFPPLKHGDNILYKEYEGDYCLLDDVDMVMDCIDAMELRAERIVSVGSDVFESVTGVSSQQQQQQQQQKSISMRGWTDKLPGIGISETFHSISNKSNLSVPLFDQNRPNITLKSLLKTNATAQAVVTDVLSALLPLAVYDSLHTQCPTPPLGSIITGPRSSGKSTLCTSISDFMKTSGKTVTHTQYFDCRSLRGKQTGAILDILSKLFTKAKKLAPSFLCLDNLDVICPSSLEGSSSTVSPVQHHIVIMQMKHLLADLSELATQKYEYASKSIKEELLVKEALTESDYKNRNESVSGTFDLAVSDILSGSVYVLATGDFHRFS